MAILFQISWLIENCRKVSDTISVAYYCNISVTKAIPNSCMSKNPNHIITMTQFVRKNWPTTYSIYNGS